MPQPDFNGAVRVTDPVAPFDVGALGLQGRVAETKMGADAVCIFSQSFKQRSGGFSVHAQRRILFAEAMRVKAQPPAGSQQILAETLPSRTIGHTARYTDQRLRKGMTMSDQTQDTIPLFPLANVVLFPGTHAPLYIFEPRYREMTIASMKADRRIGMVAVKPEQREDMLEDPDLFEIGCEGIISQAEEQADGTWNLVLTATQRFKIVQEHPRPRQRGYRTAAVEYLEDNAASSASLPGLREGICTRLTEILHRMTPQGEVAPATDQLDALDDAQLVSALAQGLDFGVLEKQRLLEATGLESRATILSDLLQFRIAEINSLSSPGSDQLQ